ncbi:MAG: hypothetical protein EPN61_14650 [Burkholderiaceae bacterium]|nr:MAG: hypothetical protein EPN61_14650 [Burkholderiaceae bacterium]
MERESLLTILVVLLGGLALQPAALLSLRALPAGGGRAAERSAWLRLWLPVVPTLLVAAWLCGWALQEPDPVHDYVDRWVLIGACLPFALVAVRAVLRAIWALAQKPAERDICTAGLLRPRILFSPFLAKALDEGQVGAAWEHERAHVRHCDPLRIWLAQIATDMQWPWPWARERFNAWLEVLECARDDEARRNGASGVDLAAAVLATVRQSVATPSARGTLWKFGVPTDALLVGNLQALQRRIARLLSPLQELEASPGRLLAGLPSAEVSLIGALLIACALGVHYGEHLLPPLLAWFS